MMNMPKNHRKKYIICINNEGYQASLELRKIYSVIPDNQAAEHHLVRVVDETGEDYLYPINSFVPIDLPEEITNILSTVA
jgi:hypothetical protein